MSTSATSGVVGQQGQQASGYDAYSKLDMSAFLQMLIAELQNQDPMEPVSNTEILQQVSQIKAIASNQQLSDTMQAVQLGQNVSTASNLLGRAVAGLSDNDQRISGQVDSVTIENGAPLLHIGNDTMKLSNVSEIDPQ